VSLFIRYVVTSDPISGYLDVDWYLDIHSKMILFYVSIYAISKNRSSRSPFSYKPRFIYRRITDRGQLRKLVVSFFAESQQNLKNHVRNTVLQRWRITPMHALTML
jgi:hypothetical protein